MVSIICRTSYATSPCPDSFGKHLLLPVNRAQNGDLLLNTLVLTVFAKR
jgi:hypothetical protein